MLTTVQPQVTTEIVQVTPAIAHEWLDKNTNNRNLRRGVVNKYARDMLNGRWRFNGETIQFDRAGNLLNGQHRLNAVIVADMTIPFMVVRGLEPEAGETLDAGARRTPGDVLALAGYPDAKVLASIARLALQVEISRKVARETRNWTTAEVKARVEEDDWIVQVVEDVMPNLPRALNSLMSRSVLGYAYYRLSRVDAEAAARFFESLGTLANLSADSPILALHRRLNAKYLQGVRTPMYQFEALACIFVAWNAWRRGEGRTLIRVPHADDGRIALVTPV